MPPTAIPNSVVPLSSPTVLCTVRDTNSGSCGWPSAALRAASNPMACPTALSPSTLATRKASRPARSPTSMPRMSRARTTSAGALLVAGEAEQMPAVMHELVHVVPADQRRRSLFGADEVQREEQEQSTEQQEGSQGPPRDRGKRRCLGGRGGLQRSGVRHDYLLGASRPGRGVGVEARSDFPSIASGHSGATVPGSHRLP